MSIHYRYDELSRLVAAGTEGGQEIVYAYDDAGNQVSATVQAAAVIAAPTSAPKLPKPTAPLAPPPPPPVAPSALTRMAPPVVPAAVPPAPRQPTPMPPAAAVAPPVEKTSNRNLIIALVVIVLLLCCCFPMLIGIIYAVAKNAGILPASLGGAARQWLLAL